MPIKERIIKELQSGPKKYKALKTKFKATKKFFAAMEELYQQPKTRKQNLSTKCTTNTANRSAKSPTTGCWPLTAVKKRRN